MNITLPTASNRILVAFVVLCLCLVTPALAVRPTVVEAEPDNGAKDVDPTLRQIVIKFDQDMSQRGHSICGGGETFPKLVGKSRWANQRTFIMTVRLEPNHDYNFSINCPSAQNFRSKDGESVVPYRISFRTGVGEDGKSELSQAELNEGAIEILREMIDQQYSYRDRMGLDWDKLFADHKKMLVDSTTPKRFAQIAGVMLAHAEDKHIWLDAEGDRIGAYPVPGKPNANAQLLPNLVPNYQQKSDIVYTGEFEDGIGYLRIDSWSPNDPRAYEAVYRYLGEHPDAPGIIIDVRFNGGGGEDLAQDLAGCFISEPVVYAKNVYRDPNSETGYTDVLERTLYPNTGRPHYDGKIAVLSGNVVMSSCEAFILMMKQAPNASIIGEPTRGSSGNPRSYDLGNGVTVYLPSWKAMRPDGTVFEGEGIQPDLLVETQLNDFQNADPVLEAALKHLRK